MPLPCVAFIGSGNVAWHLAPALDGAGYSVSEVFSPNHTHARALASRLYRAEALRSLDFTLAEARVFIIAASDDAIEEILREIRLPDYAALIHTSGSKPLAVPPDGETTHAGVFYPVQTFSKARPARFKGLPILLEADSPAVERIMMDMARALAAEPHKCTFEKRCATHLSAVFACNFVNHLLAIGSDILHRHQLELKTLEPLVRETIDKALELGPARAQTGPAARGDWGVIQDHLELLERHDETYAEIYQLITQDIHRRSSSDPSA